MPSAFMEFHVLSNRSIALHDQMRRDAQGLYFGEIWMYFGRQRIGEQPIDPRTAELSRRQTDAVYDDEIGLNARRTRVPVR